MWVEPPPSATRAMSPRRTREPSGWVLMRMLRNSSGVFSSVCEVTVALSCWPSTAGRPPNWPAVTWAFWVSMAERTSDTVRP